MDYSVGLIILISFCALAKAASSTKAEKYTSRWDNINVDEILKSDRLLENYKKCLMDQGKCTAEGRELRSNLPDALQNECLRCTDKQKENTEKVLDYMMENKKAWWEELQKKYDPTGKYYERRMKKKRNNNDNNSKKDNNERDNDKSGDSNSEGEKDDVAHSRKL